MMRLASILLALAALGTALLAAYKWYKASTVEIDLGYTYPGSQPGETQAHDKRANQLVRCVDRIEGRQLATP